MSAAVVVNGSSLLLGEQQMAWKDAVFGQAVVTTSRHQINSVLLLQLNVYVATGYDVTLLLGGEWVQNQLSVMEQIQTGVVDVHGGVEAELVHAWNLACKISRPHVITFLSVVDDIFESNGLVSFREVVAQSHREGNFSRSIAGR